MCLDEDYKKLNHMVPFYGRDKHLSRFCVNTGL